jgi:hypothetical protein
MPSAPTGLKNWATKAQRKYDQLGSMMAIKREASADTILVSTTIQSPRMRWTSKPTPILARAPDTGAGKNRRAVPRGLLPWTSWKKKLAYCSKALNAAQTQKTLKQMQENPLCCQREFGIRAGRPRRSWRPTQSTNAARKTNERTSRVMLTGCLITVKSPVRALQHLSVKDGPGIEFDLRYDI